MGEEGPEEGPRPEGGGCRTLARRAFLREVGRISAGVVCAGAAIPLAGCMGISYAPATLVGGRLRVEESALAEEDHVLVENPRDARPIFLRRRADGSYSAVSTRCTHRGCQVAPRGPRLACPCHGSEYTLDGGLLEGPAEHPLQGFATEVRDGAVLITLNEAASP